jgi:hypothetical protein
MISRRAAVLSTSRSIFDALRLTLRAQSRSRNFKSAHYQVYYGRNYKNRGGAGAFAGSPHQPVPLPGLFQDSNFVRFTL